jgi:hypothetical protein
MNWQGSRSCATWTQRDHFHRLFSGSKNSLRIVPEPLIPFVMSLKHPIKAYVPDMHFNSGSGSRWLGLCKWFVGVRREQTIQWRKETKPRKKSSRQKNPIKNHKVIYEVPKSGPDGLAATS